MLLTCEKETLPNIYGHFDLEAMYWYIHNCYQQLNILMLQYYDIRKKCEGSLCYDFSNMEKFLNQKSVRDSLGVGKIHFVSCSTEVYMALLVDWMRNLEVGIPALLEDGINLLIYAGEYDLICNWLGTYLLLSRQRIDELCNEWIDGHFLGNE